MFSRTWQLRTRSVPVQHEYSLCGMCGHLFVSNPPDGEFLRDYYETLSQTLRQPRGVDPIETAVFANQADFMTNSFPGKRILEIGCDTGQFLDFLHERGAITFFDELSHNARKILFERALHVEWSPAVEDLDWIVIRHTLEHVPQPLAWLSNLPPLGRDGRLFIEVPDWTHLDTDTDSLNFEHLHQFTVASLCTLLLRAGYAVESVNYASTPGYHTTPNRILRVRAHPLTWKGDRADRIEAVVEEKANALARNFSALLKLHDDRRVAVYAASWFARTLCLQGEMLTTKICALYDSDPAKQGSDFSGFVVRTPDSIASDNPDTIVILSSYEHEIEKYLRDEVRFKGAIVGVSALMPPNGPMSSLPANRHL